MSYLRQLSWLILVTCVISIYCQRSRSNVDGINAMSWRLRQLTNQTSLSSTDSGTLREIAVVLLPCQEMLDGSHLRRFLTKLFMHSNVDYHLTRVSLWVGEGPVREDQIGNTYQMKTYCTLMENLRRALSDPRSTVRQDFNSTNLFQSVQNVLFPRRQRLNQADAKYLVIFHCGLQIELPDSLGLLANLGNVFNFDMPQIDDFALTELPMHQQRNDQYRIPQTKRPANRASKRQNRLTSRKSQQRLGFARFTIPQNSRSRTLGTSATPRRSSDPPYWSSYADNEYRSRGSDRVHRPPHVQATTPNSLNNVQFLLEDMKRLDTLSSKAFLKDLQGPSYSPASGCQCRREFDTCVCNRQTGEQHCLCEAGHFQDSRTQECRQCPGNTYSSVYSNRDAESTCKPCPDINQMSPEGSIEERACVCKPGYKTVSGVALCAQITCPALSPPTHGIIVGGRCDVVLNAACGIRCDTGYDLIGSSVRVCTADGLWSGINATCQVKQCKHLQPPKHGSMKCTSDDFSYSTTCRFTCIEGYTLLGPVKRSCLSVGHWSGIETFCQDVQCPSLPRVLNGHVDPVNCTSSSQDYGVICKLSCRHGFNLVGPPFKQCSNTGTWVGTTYDWQCVDNEPPDIQCPQNITIPADPKSYLTTVATIKPPKVRDKSAILSIVQLPGQLVTQFPLGAHEITYKVEDVWNNMAQCDFVVNVVDKTAPAVESCLPPSPVVAELYARTNIPQPQFSDNPVLWLANETTNNGLTVTSDHSFRNAWPYGVTTVNVLAADKSGNSVTCNFNVTVLGLSDMCKKAADIKGTTDFKCDSANGTVTRCFVYCRDGWGIAYIADTEEYQCDNGVITPHLVPDCSEANPSLYQEVLKSTLEISESCEDHREISKAIDSISEQLSLHLTTLCTDVFQCTSAASDYTCVPNATYSTLHLKYSIGIQAVAGLVSAEDSQAMLKETVLFLEAFLSGGLFIGIGLPDGFRHDVSFTVTRRKISCGDGQTIRAGVCYDCPRGTFLSRYKDCQMCSAGSYQDVPASSACKHCDAGKTTKHTGAKDMSQCLVECESGSYSPSGLDEPQAPCRTCERGFYQPRQGQTNCIPCYSKYTTMGRGAHAASECLALCVEGYVSRTGVAPCVPCPRHSYQSDIGQTYCHLCPNGTMAQNPGAKRISQCTDARDDDGSKIEYSSARNDRIQYSECFHYPCLQASTCHSLFVGFYCACQSGFTGTFCEIEANECHSSPCLNNGRCLDLVNEYRCQCPFGWTGQRCEVEVEECMSAPCLHGGSCVDKVDGYQCLCKRGFSGLHCEIDINECYQQPCKNNATCTDLVGRFSCGCPAGFRGRLCETEINECESFPCLNRATCINTPGSFRCECLRGFGGGFCEVNVDECLSMPCLNNALCEDHDNDFLCLCKPGFGGRHCDKVLTSDYILQFDGDAESYAHVNFTANQVFTALSVSFWMRSNDTSHLGTPFSYANHKYGNSFTLTDYTGLLLYVNDEVRATDIVLNDALWHFVAVTWSNDRGIWQIYVDGVLADGGSSLRYNDVISGGGRFIIGQEQDDLSASFNDIESFVGDITFVQVWNHVILGSDILAMFTFCDEFTGNVIAWPEFRFSISGIVSILNSTFCAACERPADLENGDVIWSDVLTAGVAIYSCEPGYFISGSEQRSCLVTGEWSDTQPSCIIVDCGRPPRFLHSTVTASNTTHSNIARYDCDEGYRGEARLTCTADGSWYGNDPNCTRVTCESPDISPPLLIKALRRSGPSHTVNNDDVGSGEPDDADTAHNLPVSDRLVHYIGDIMSFTCNTGYVISGASDVICGRSGTWSNLLPVCERISQCTSNPPDVDGASYITSNDTGTLVAEYNCLPGWDMLGNSTLPCLGDSWLNVQVICTRTKCPSPHINNSIIVSDSEYLTHLYGDSVDVSCQIGYRLLGPSKLHCTEHGIWDHTFPVCEPVHCAEFRNDTEWTVILMSSKPPQYGTKATFSCDDGYEIIGEHILTCLSTGLWSHAVPFCELVNCDVPQPAPHATVTVTSSLYKSVAEYMCESGYVMEGDGMVSCTADGTWSQAGFQCSVIRCPTPIPPPNSIIDLEGVTHGSKARYQCLRGFLLENSIEAYQEQRCLSNRTWSPPIQYCVKIFCQHPANLLNGVVYASNTSYGDKVYYECDEGYILRGRSESECLSDKSWSSEMPTCEIATCDAPQSLTDGSLNASGTTYGSRLKYKCNKGYQLFGYANAGCTSYGVWSHPPPICNITSCPLLIGLQNGHINLTNGTLYGSQARFSCVDGHSLRGNSEAYCLDTGVWSSQLPVCKLAHCAMLTRYIEHGVIQQNETVSGSKAKLVCDKGYESSYEYATTLTCSLSGLWTCPDGQLYPNCSGITCQPINCPIPDVDEYTIPAEPLSLEYLSVVKYRCSNGYRYNENPIRQCQANRTWSGESGDCQLITCPGVDDNQNDTALSFSYRYLDSNYSLVLGTVASFACAEGYRLIGTRHIECTDTSTWNTTLPRCQVISCQTPPEIEHGVVNYTGLTYQSVAGYQCLPRYRLNGPPVRTCNEQGLWSGFKATCAALTCPEIVPVLNGRVDYESSLYGSNATFTCLKGYSLQGVDFIRCESDGSWSHPLPTCDIISCPNLVSPDHGYHTGNSTFGSVVWYHCNVGFRLVGIERNYCQANKTWLHNQGPECRVKSCSEPMRPHNGVWTSDLNGTIQHNISGLQQNNASSQYTIGTRLTADCNDGHINPNSNQTILCMPTMKWNYTETPTCVPVECPELSVTNGYVDGSMLTFNSSARLFCDDGYRLNGTEPYKLVQCGADGTWTDTMPTCSIVTCNIPAEIDNIHYTGEAVNSDVNGYFTYNSSVTASCDDGFTLSGDTTLICGADGYWISNQPPSCTRNYCRHPGKVEFGQVYGRTAETLDVGERIVVVCRIGYELNGAIVSRCQENGKWSSGMPRCHPISCPPPTNIANGRVVIVDEMLFKSVIRYECEPSYSIQGNTERMCLASKNWNGEEPQCVPRPCDQPPIISNGLISSDITSFYPNNAIQYRCAAGFDIQGNSTIVCDGEGRWPIILPTCVRVCLNPFLAIDHAMHNESDVDRTYTEGDLVNVECEIGYFVYGNSLMRCRPEGFWEGRPNIPLCEAIKCPITEHNHLRLIGENRYNATVSFECEEGFDLEGESEAVCQENGVWSSPIPRCALVDCGEVENIDNGVVEYTVTSYGSTAIYTCATGYHIEGNNFVTCSSNSSWAPSNLACVPVRCSGNFTVTHGEFVTNSTRYGSEARLICDLGYYPRNDVHTSICNEDGYWIPAVDSCRPLVCLAPPTIPGTLLLSASDIKYFYGDYAEYSCLDGYRPASKTQMSITCSEEGLWSGMESIRCMKSTCQLPDYLPTEMVMTIETAALKGFNVLFSCIPGYRLLGSVVSHCDGTAWSAELPTCQPRLCDLERPQAIDHSVFIVTELSPHRSKAQYICDEGYSMGGDGISYCEQTRGWESTISECEIERCPVPRLPKGLQLYQESNSSVYNYGDVVELLCEPGYYSVEEALQLTCQANGSWSDSLPHCLPKYCESLNLTITHGYIIPVGYSYGSMAIINCKEGYALAGANKITCEEDGHWSHAYAECLARQCTMIELSAHMTVDSNADDTSIDTPYFVNDTIKLKCGRGFQITPAAVYRCEKDGLWNMTLQPTCEALSVCTTRTPPPNTQLNGSLLHEEKYFSGDKMTYTCDAGYIGSVTNVCSTNSTWQHLIGSCQPISCGRPLADDQAIIHGDMYTYKNFVAYTCPLGYKRRSAAFLQCLSSGNWSSNPECYADGLH